MRYLFSAMLLIGCMTFFACHDRSNDGPFTGEVRNHTKEDFTEVAVKGKGYPGSFGNLVSTGMASMTYYRGDVVDDEFEVSWKNTDGVIHTKILKRPANFGQSREMDLIIEFTEDGDVKAYTELAPWVGKY